MFSPFRGLSSFRPGWVPSGGGGGTPALLDRSGWTATASHNSGVAGNAIDTLSYTYWVSNSAQASGMYWQVDLGASFTISKVLLTSNGGDYVRAYEVYVGASSTGGTAIASGTAATGTTTKDITPTTGRYIRITATASDGSWWELNEFNAWGY